jgi:putative sigma-54 modulation protein
MQTRITARHVDVSNGLRAHIENSMSRLGRYYNGIHGAHIVLDGCETRVAGKSAEVTVSVRQNLLRAQQEAESHEEAVNRCVRQLRRQVLRYKNRVRSTNQHRHR